MRAGAVQCSGEGVLGQGAAGKGRGRWGLQGEQIQLSECRGGGQKAVQGSDGCGGGLGRAGLGPSALREEPGCWGQQGREPSWPQPRGARVVRAGMVGSEEGRGWGLFQVKH